MMFMQVDLPEPDWPTMATNDMIGGLHQGIAHLVVLADRIKLNQCAHRIPPPGAPPLGIPPPLGMPPMPPGIIMPSLPVEEMVAAVAS